MRTVPVVVLLACALPAQVRDVEQLEKLEPVLQAAIAKVEPSVVTVETFGGMRKKLAGGRIDPSKRDGQKPIPDSRPNTQPVKPPDEDKKPKQPKLVMDGFLQAQGATTGVVLTSDGWILISRFALNFDPTTVLVTLPDGRSFEAQRGGEDKSRGLALVKIEASGLTVPSFVDPKDVRVGQWAAALGRTFGKGSPSVHLGIVSAVRRQLGRALQTDAGTSPANYGGPLIDIDGRVLGVTVPLAMQGEDAGVDLYDSGIGFAATVADIGELLERMKQGEVLHRGWLGISTKIDFLGPGAIVQSIAGGSPATGAGLKKGDKVVAIDDVAVRHNFHLQTLLGSKTAGEAVHLKIERGKDQEPFGITVFLGAPPAQ